jgi:predicted nuclease of predicted toxin-antitoxin system
VRIFADENVPRRAVEGLRAAGHDVMWGVEGGHGLSDVVRLDEAVRAGRVVLTEDQDFADLAFRDGLPVVAIIRFSLAGMKRDAKADRIVAGVTEIGDDAAGKVHVIEPQRIRTRPLP